MRILRPTLIGLTLGLSVVSVYLATLVADARTRAQDVAQQRREVTLRLERLTVAQSKGTSTLEPAAGEQTAPAVAPTPATVAPTEDEEDPDAGWTRASSTYRLRELTNPARRAAMRTQQREWQREGHPRLANELHLSAEEADELFSILAEQSLRYEERYHRNHIAKRREYIDDTRLDATAQEELTALLGSEGFRELVEYRDGLPERRRIDALTERLGKTDAFSASEATQLTQIMRAERAAFEGELQRLPGDVRFRGGAPEDARLRGAEGPAQQRFGENQVARIESFYARVRERAAVFLSPAQMQRLQQLQNERVARVQADYLWARYVGPAEKAMEAAQAAREAK
jgi:hypothetical protein